MLNLATLLEESTRQHPNKLAVVFNKTKLTYAQVNGAANQVAQGLTAMGVQPGDKVAMSCLNLPYFPIVYYGILKTGATVVPLNVLLKGKEIAYHLQDSDAKVYFCFEGTEALPMGQFGHEGFEATDSCESMIIMTADPTAPSPIEGITTLGQFMHGQSPQFSSVPTSSSDTAVILYTSGTTGQAKGAELSHANMVFNARLGDNDLFYRNEEEVHLIALPLFHSFGQTAQMNGGIYQGATLVLMARFDPDVALQLMEQHNVTYFAGVPTMYWAILNHPDANKYDLDKIAKTLTTTVSGGSAMPVEVMQAFQKKYNVKILEGYGLSETSPIATFNRYTREAKPGSIGMPVWGIEMRVVDIEGNDLPPGEQGELLIKGHNVMKGYYNRPDATAAAIKDGWFHTGDIGKRDEEGYYYITDRVKDLIIRGGFNVYPREIEEKLLTHPAISLVAVIGIPHDSLGEEVKAFVILKDNASATEDELIAWGKEHLAAFKYPRHYAIVESLPMTATGKILKRQLRSL